MRIHSIEMFDYLYCSVSPRAFSGDLTRLGADFLGSWFKILYGILLDFGNGFCDASLNVKCIKGAMLRQIWESSANYFSVVWICYMCQVPVFTFSVQCRAFVLVRCLLSL